MLPDTTYPLAVLWSELQLFVKGLSDGLEYLFDFESRKWLQCPTGHHDAEGFELQLADEPSEDDVAAAGVVVTEHGVGGLSRHVESEDARSCFVVRCCSDDEMEMRDNWTGDSLCVMFKLNCFVVGVRIKRSVGAQCEARTE